ncbi:MAG: alpha/beta hydrolase [Thermodesulfobacteriota bacterium]
MNIAAETFMHNGIAIKYRESGKGNVLIFLHGFGTSSYSWRYIYTPLSQKYKVIMLDLKGFGLSDKPKDGKYSVNDQADIIVNFIRTKKITSVTLIGHSLGGAVAWLTYVKLSEIDDNPIKSLILIDSAGYEQNIPSFIATLRTPVINKLILLLLPNDFSAKLVLRKAFFDDRKITREMIETYAGYMELPGAHYALIKTAEQLIPNNVDEITKKLKDIRIPVLIIWGEEDEIVPISIGQKFENDIPNSKLIKISQSGHVPHEERPSETLRLISDFLKTQYGM